MLPGGILDTIGLDERRAGGHIVPLDWVLFLAADRLAEAPFLLDAYVTEDLMLAAEPAALLALFPALDQAGVLEGDRLARLALVVPVRRQGGVALLPRPQVALHHRCLCTVRLLGRLGNSFFLVQWSM